MSEVFENGNPVTTDAKPEKKKRKRKPLTEEQKKALVERLAKARAVKKANKAKDKEEPAKVEMKVEEPVKEPTKPVEVKVDRSREKELEIANLRHELELQKLRNELDKARKPPRKPRARTILPVAEEKDEPKPIIDEKPKVVSVAESKAEQMETIIEEIEPIVNTPPKPKKIIGRLAPRNIWDF
jgi:hypothetical protein